jgi:hypothetical protein
MKYNSVIIATNADFLADMPRDKLQDLDVGVVLAVRNENELFGRIKNNHPRFGVISFSGKREKDWPKDDLYRPLKDTALEDKSPCFIPYYAWANRGPGEMTV